MAESPDKFLPLVGGYIVPVEALRLAWRLEDAGFKFRLSDDGALLVAPFNQLTEGQLGEVKQWKQHLVALIRYGERLQATENGMGQRKRSA